MADLLTHVIPFLADQWRDLGWQLLKNEDTNVINQIGAGLQNVQLCAELLFIKWRNFNYKTCTWDQIITSLKTPSIGLNALAEKLRGKLSSGELPGIVINL